MNRYIVTGASGYLGRNLIKRLLDLNISVVGISRTRPQVSNPLYEHLNLDFKDFTKVSLDSNDKIVHLAWVGIPDYNNVDYALLSFNESLKFLKYCVDSCVNKIFVPGTCLEYGLIKGEQSESMTVVPTTPYGIYKNRLRNEIFEYSNNVPIIWGRLYYVYGGDQHKSLYTALLKADSEGLRNFNMSPGDQIRDFIHLEKVLDIIMSLLELPANRNEVYNICSGEPIAVLDYVKKIIKSHGLNLKPNPGFYSYADYEAKDFWGSTKKLIKKLS